MHYIKYMNKELVVSKDKEALKKYVSSITVPTEVNELKNRIYKNNGKLDGAFPFGEAVEAVRVWAKHEVPGSIWWDTDNDVILAKPPTAEYPNSTFEVRRSVIIDMLFGKELGIYLA